MIAILTATVLATALLASEPALGSLASILYLLGGLVLLGVGADVMVRGASILALRLRLTPTVIGLTVVALGTSLPELMVSVAAQYHALDGNSELQAIAWGNVVGSNIFNIGLVLGLSSVFRPLEIPGSTVRLEYPFMVGSALLAALLVRTADGHHELDRLEGAFFLVIFALFTAYVIRLARREVTAQERASLREKVSEVTSPDIPEGSLLRGVTYTVIGCILLAYGGDLLINGAESLALNLGISHRVVSTVIVAALTGAPELFTTIVAVLHKKTGMAVANVVGSNIFNTLLVLGAASAIFPLEVADEGLTVDLSLMIGISLLLGPFLVGKAIPRIGGVCLLLAYVGYTIYLLMTALG